MQGRFGSWQQARCSPGRTAPLRRPRCRTGLITLISASHCAYRRLLPVAGHCGDGGDEAGQCNEQPRELYEQSPDLRGETTQEGHGPDQGADAGLRLAHAPTMVHHHRATVE
jgi:hypothetical protein